MPTKRPISRFIQGICLICNKNKQMSCGFYKGKKVYKRTCTRCSMKNDSKKLQKNKDRIRVSRYPYSKHKKNYCENCGFIPIHKCQLDVDHIDGNKNNNHIDNFRTLCANCHRLKTFLNKDWKPKI
jgi:hypothetical protein